MAAPESPIDNIHDLPKPSLAQSKSYNYPFAASPDIIRSNQKDTYFQGVLLEHLLTILRRLYGSRFAHTHDSEARTFTELLYLGLTTFIGNRTLGEEYCDIYQVEAPSHQLPAISRRSGYILTAVLLPYALSKTLPTLRGRIRLRLEKNLNRTPKSSRASLRYRIQNHILLNLNALTSISTSPLYAVNLAIFYFSGSYYHLSKRLFNLRYIFSKRLAPSEQRVGYEVLGVLLVLQLVVLSYLHVHRTITTPLPTEGSPAFLDDDVGFDSTGDSEMNDSTSLSEKAETSRLRISHTTHTPIPPSSKPRYDLSEPSALAWMQPTQQRKCTLCLEPMKDPSLTTCGHVFCWTCILDWVAEKPECPLCRQGVLGQHVLPLRG